MFLVARVEVVEQPHPDGPFMSRMGPVTGEVRGANVNDSMMGADPVQLQDHPDRILQMFQNMIHLDFLNGAFLKWPRKEV
jgi:hypothetical protein